MGLRPSINPQYLRFLDKVGLYIRRLALLGPNGGVKSSHLNANGKRVSLPGVLFVLSFFLSFFVSFFLSFFRMLWALNKNDFFGQNG